MARINQNLKIMKNKDILLKTANENDLLLVGFGADLSAVMLISMDHTVDDETAKQLYNQIANYCFNKLKARKLKANNLFVNK